MRLEWECPSNPIRLTEDQEKRPYRTQAFRFVRQKDEMISIVHCRLIVEQFVRDEGRAFEVGSGEMQLRIDEFARG
jgi:hypothetical protein